MTEVQARSCLQKIRRHLGQTRQLLMDFHQAQGWLALDYKTWAECAENELGISTAQAYRQLNAATVEQRLGIADRRVPEVVLRQIGYVQEDKQPEAWERLEEEVKKSGDKKITEDLAKKVVRPYRKGTGKKRVKLSDAEKLRAKRDKAGRRIVDILNKLDPGAGNKLNPGVGRDNAQNVIFKLVKKFFEYNVDDMDYMIDRLTEARDRLAEKKQKQKQAQSEKADDPS